MLDKPQVNLLNRSSKRLLCFPAAGGSAAHAGTLACKTKGHHPGDSFPDDAFWNRGEAAPCYKGGLTMAERVGRRDFLSSLGVSVGAAALAGSAAHMLAPGK